MPRAPGNVPGFRPAPIVPPSARVITGFNNSVGTRPGQALNGLRQSGNVLTPQQRTILARTGVKTLAQRVTQAGNPRLALEEVRLARSGNLRMDPRLELVLESLEHKLTVRVLADTLEGVPPAGKDGPWIKAGETARAQLERAQLPAEGKKVLEGVVRVGRQVEGLARLEATVAKINWNRPSDVAAALRGVGLEHLPGRLQTPVRGLRSLAELRQATGKPWNQAPDVVRLKQNLADLRLGGCERHWIDRVQLDLSAKAFLEGFTAEAHALLPEFAPSEHAGQVLRDMKALVLGKGEVRTDPAKQVLKTAPGQNPEPPPGLKPLIPEGAAEAWRPQVKESARSDLPPLEQAAAQVEKPFQEQVHTGTRQHRKAVFQDASQVRHHAHVVHQQLVKRDQDDDKRRRDLEARMFRRLNEAERALARQLGRQGKTAADIMAALREANLEQEVNHGNLSEVARLRLHLESLRVHLSVFQYGVPVSWGPAYAYLQWELRRTINQFTQAVEKAPQAPDTLRHLRLAQEKPSPVGLDVQPVLRALEFHLVYQGLVRELKAILGPARQNQWTTAATRAQLHIKDGPAAGWKDDPRHDLARWRKLLQDVAWLGQQVEPLDQVAVALKADEKKTRATGLTPWCRLPFTQLSADLQAPLRGLHGLAHLKRSPTKQVYVAEKRQYVTVPDVALLKGSVADIQAGSGDADLAARLLQDLAVQAFLDGHNAEALALLPANGSAKHAAELLDDLKALVLGKGQVTTGPARQAARGKPGPGGMARIPSGLRPLVPENQKAPPGPLVQQSADLPPLEQVLRLEKPFRERAARRLQEHRRAFVDKAAQTLQGMELLVQKGTQLEEQAVNLMGQLEAALTGRLTPAERVLVWDLCYQGRTVADIRVVLEQEQLAERANKVAAKK
jgi:hypothetical protein